MLAGAALALAVFASAQTPSPSPSPSSSSPSPSPSTVTPEIDRALSGVVLLVTSLDGGLSSYGSGIVLDKKGFVLTNLHVLDGAKAVYALPWDPAKPSYAAVDGGLSRLVFEREKELVPVTLIRGDPVLDLAVVRLDKPTPVIPVTLQTAEPAIGESVTAVGHPEQNFWSVTRGQVSGRHQGLIQHDAAINKGNSGGPLLNAKGEVVGINTSFLKGAQGIFYARPVAMASKLVDHVQEPLVLDRSTPEKSVTSCARARELASPAYSQCIHWGSHYAWFHDYVTLALKSGGAWMNAFAVVKSGGPKSRAKTTVTEWLDKGEGRAEVWARKYGPYALSWVLTDDPAELGRQGDAFLQYIQDGTRGGKPPPTRARSKYRDLPAAEMHKRAEKLSESFKKSGYTAEERKMRGTIQKETGLKVEIDDGPAIRRTLKMGLRAEKATIVGDRAWVEVRGRNIDGSPYRYSVYLSKQADGWRESVPTQSDWEAGKLKPPAGYAMPLWFGSMPLGALAIFAVGDLVEHVVVDDPAGINYDHDFEHLWPSLFELMRADAIGGDGSALSALTKN